MGDLLPILDGRYSRGGSLPANVSDFPLRMGEYYGQVATNCRIQTYRTTSGSISQIVRCHHVAKTDIDCLSAVIGNWYWLRDTNGISRSEIASPSSATWLLQVEKANGDVAYFPFKGSAKARMTEGAVLVSDFLPISIAAGEEFWTNLYFLSETGFLLCSRFPQNGNTGERYRESSSLSFLNETMLPVANTEAASNLRMWNPHALISRTSGKALFISGHSIEEGAGDKRGLNDAYGMAEHCVIDHDVATINAGCAGDQVQQWLKSNSYRVNLARYCNNAWCHLDVNDIAFLNPTLAQLQANLLNYWSKVKSALAGDGKVFVTTSTTETNSTDYWTTLGNQTPATNFSITGNGVREQYNDWLRDGAPTVGGVAVAVGTSGALRAGDAGHPVEAVFDTATVVESALNSGKWNVTGAGSKATSASVSSASKAVTVTGGAFVSGDVGKAIVIPGAGAAAADLQTYIATVVSGSSITVEDAAGTTVSNVNVYWGMKTFDGVHLNRASYTEVADSGVVDVDLLVGE